MSGRRARLDAVIARLGSAQHGAVARRQIIASGGTDDDIALRVARGSLHRLRLGVYAVSGSPATWEQDLMGACLAVGQDAVIGGPTAAALHGLLRVAPNRIEVWVPGPRRVRRSDLIVRRCRDLREKDVTRVDGIPCLSVTRTLIALASQLDVATLETVVDDALRRKMTNVVRLHRRIEELGSGGRKGLPVLARMVGSRRAGVHDSELEKRFVEVLRRYRMPLPEYHPKITLDGKTYEPDFLYRAARIFIETDGLKGHASRADLEYSNRRQNAFVKAGYRPMRFTWADVEERGLQMCKDLAAAAHLPWEPPPGLASGR
ncbi:MAG TPA: type IV toxin-antitoxin system AbiEi family antitoxin [Actinomycetota bacterium]|nr:type IV toxin-antitoxin system AbiEi family antitoxin [Actinomycetota bacterium]